MLTGTETQPPASIQLTAKHNKKTKKMTLVDGKVEAIRWNKPHRGTVEYSYDSASGILAVLTVVKDTKRKIETSVLCWATWTYGSTSVDGWRWNAGDVVQTRLNDGETKVVSHGARV